MLITVRVTDIKITRCYEGFDSGSVLLFSMAAWWSKAARCCRFHSLAYKLPVCDSSCWCVPRSAIVPCFSTRISSASITVASRWAMIIVVRFAIARFNAPRIFWNGDNKHKIKSMHYLQVWWSILLSGKKVCWTHCMLPRCESRKYAYRTDRQMDRCQTITLCFALWTWPVYTRFTSMHMYKN